MNGHGGRLPRLRRLLRGWGARTPGNIGLGLLSLALALAAWVAVRVHQNPVEERTYEVPVVARNVPAGYLVVNITPAKVYPRFRLPRNVARDYRADGAEAIIDLARAVDEAEPNDPVILERSVKLRTGRDDVRAEAVDTPVKVTLEKARTRRVPVQVRTSGAVPLGYRAADSLQPEPAEVVVIGSKANTDSVAYVGADVRLDGLTVSVDYTVNLQPRNSEGQPIGGVTVQPDKATVRVKIEQESFRRQVVVEVRLRGQPRVGMRVASVSADPPMVTLYGPLDQINTLLSVPTDFVDIEGAAQDVKRLVRLQLPQGVSTRGETLNVTVHVGIQVVRGIAPLAVVPRVDGLAPGLMATVSPPVVALIVSGPLADLTQLRATDATVIVDAAGLRPGKYEVQPRVATLAPALQLESLAPARVEITIVPVTGIP